MSDKIKLIKEEIEKQRQLIWPSNTGEMKVVKTPKPIEQGWLNCLKWVEDLIDSLQEDSNVKNEDSSDECPCCGWALDSDGCCSSCGYGRK